MNASDIIKMKQDSYLYTAYYNPSVYQSTVVSTLIPFSTISSGTASYTSTIDTVYTYECLPTFVSYQLANNVNNGAYVCGDKVISILDWNNTISSLQLYYSTSGVGGISTITSSFVLRAPGPVICPLVQLYQGVQTISNCSDTYYTCNGSSDGYCNYYNSGY
jgi:hypothetical protein